MDAQRDNKERNSIANIPMKYWIRTQQNIQRIKTIVQQSQDLSISTQSPQGKPSVQNKYKTIIEQQRNLCYRYAFKLTTKKATQPKRPATSYQQVSMIPKNQMKLDSISSHDMQGGNHRKTNSVTQQYQNYQKEAITNNITSQTPTANSTNVDLLDMDFFSTTTSTPQQQQQQQYQNNYNRQQPYQQNYTQQKPYQQQQQQVIKQQSSESNCLDLLDSDEDDVLPPQPAKPAPQITPNYNAQVNNNVNVNSHQITPQLQQQPSYQNPQRYTSIFGNQHHPQQTPLGQQNTQNQNVNQNMQRFSNPQNNAVIPTPSPKPPLGNQQFNYQGQNEFSVKIIEKLLILQKDNNFPQGFQLNGQLMIQGDFKDDIILIELKGKNWNPQSTKHRGTPNSIPSRTNKENNAYQQNKNQI